MFVRCANAAFAAANAMPKTSEPKTTPGTSCANEHREGSADCASRHGDGVVRTEAARGDLRAGPAPTLAGHRLIGSRSWTIL